MMERALKERIVGAVVLVIFVVLVVPVFLDGPPGADEVVSARVLLPGQEDQDNKTVVLERDRSVPIPAADVDADAASDRVVAVQQAPESQPVVEPPPVVVIEEPEKLPEKVVSLNPSASETGMWAVQLGSFSDKQNAEKLAAGLRKQGFAAFLSKLAKDGGELHRVRIGPQRNRESAETMAARLSKVGHKGQVVPHP